MKQPDKQVRCARIPLAGTPVEVYKSLCVHFEGRVS